MIPVARRRLLAPGGAAGGPTTLATDTYTGTSGTNVSGHTADTGQTYAYLNTGGGTMLLTTGGRLRAGAGDTSGIILAKLSLVPGTADYSVQADFYPVDTTHCEPTIYGRVQDFNNYYYVEWNQFAGTLQLKKSVAGTGTIINSYALGNPVAGTPHTIGLTMAGTAIKVFVDGTQRISATDSAIAGAGAAGVGAQGTSMSDSTGTHLDNLVVTAP